MMALLGISVWYISGKNRIVLNTGLTIILVILIVFSSNAIMVISASANPPLNENNPDEPFNLLYFLNREQYGDRPLFRGPYFNAPRIGSKSGKPRYNDDNGRYEITSHDIVTEFDPRFITLFPVSYTHLRAHETRHDLVCRLLLE